MRDIKNRIIEEIKKIYDPEIPVNIYELGLIYDVQVSDDYDVRVLMTFTAPRRRCAAAPISSRAVAKTARLGCLRTELEATGHFTNKRSCCTMPTVARRVVCVRGPLYLSRSWTEE